MRSGRILLVDYPFTDDTGSKVRPVLIVSADRFNTGEDVVVVLISTPPSPEDPLAVEIPETAPFFKQTGLRRTSSVKWTKLLTISRRVARRNLGSLPASVMTEIQTRIQGLFRS